MIKMETLRSPPSGLLGRSLSELSGLIDEKERAYLQRLSDGPVASTCPYESMSVGADDSDGTPDIPDGPLDLESLIRQIQLQLAHKKELPLRSRLKIQQLMRQYDLGLGELDRYSHFDAGKKYTRNLIAHDDSFTLMLLCWNPGKESPIHDHPCNNGCYVKVASGEVQEHRYARDEARNKLVLTGVSTAHVGDVLYIDDGLGYHKVGNPSPHVPARTLHLYSPPFTRCNVWLSERDALDKPLKPVVTYHSEYGTVVDYEDGCAAACNALCGSAAAAVAAAAAVSPRAAATASDGSSDSADGVPAPSGGAGAAAGR